MVADLSGRFNNQRSSNSFILSSIRNSIYVYVYFLFDISIGTSDPFITMYIKDSNMKTKCEKQKTTVKKKTLAPVYNESFSL